MESKPVIKEEEEKVTEEDQKAIQRLLELTGDDHMTLEEFRRIQRGEFKR